MHIELKDPVYGLPAWQGEAPGIDDLTGTLKELAQHGTAWRPIASGKRREIITTWRSKVDNHIESISKTMSQATGLSSTQVQDDLDAWFHADLTNTVTEQHDKPIWLLTDIADLQILLPLTNYLLAGNTVMLLVPDFLYPGLDALQKLWPSDAGCQPLQVVVVDDPSQLELQALPMAYLHFYGSIAGARLVHSRLAGRFEVPAKFEVLSNGELKVDNELTDNDVKAMVKKALHHSGQSVNNLKRIWVDSAIAVKLQQQLIAQMKKIRVAAFDAEPAPFISSLPSLQYSERALVQYKQRVAHGAEALVPMRRLLGKSGMLTPGLLLLSAEQAKEDAEPIAGPVLELVLDDS